MQKRYIPTNVLSNKRILGFKRANFIQGIIETFILFAILGMIPFTVKVRWIVFFCFGSLILFANFIGVHGNSLLGALKLYLSYNKLTKTIYSYRRFSNETKRGNKKLIVNGKVKIFRQAEGTRRIKKIIGI